MKEGATMKIQAAVLHEANQDFSIEEVELAEPKYGQFLVKVAAGGVCHTDELARRGTFPFPFPVVLGHEGAGVVERLGPGVTGFEAGDHVVMSYASCGKCENCRTGKAYICEKVGELCFSGRNEDGTTPLSQNGKAVSNFFGQSTFASYAIADVQNVAKVDKDVDLRLLGPLGCGILTGAGVVINAFHPYPGDSIAVFGTGSVGIAAMMAARVCGCTKIIAVDILDARLEAALELGATHAINSKTTEDVAGKIREITKGRGADFAFDTTGVPSCLRAANLCIRSGGRAGGVAITGPIELDSWSAWFSGKQWNNFVEGNAIPQVFIPRLVDLYKSGLFPIDKLITFYSLENINEAFADSKSGKTIKPVVVMP
jgi:aryl-alcohol dehydrogenase